MRYGCALSPLNLFATTLRKVLIGGATTGVMRQSLLQAYL